MAQTLLNEELNIIANSDLEILPLDGDLAIIQKLDDEPNDVEGLTSDQLKAKFDESGLIIQKYINESLIPQILADDATEAARAAAEEQRELQEELRNQAEGQRELNEQARADETAGIVAQATQQAQLAKGWADAAQRAVYNGDHAHRHAANGGDPITYDMIGAAPGGYGYGGETLARVAAASVDESDAVYAARFDAILDQMPELSTKQVNGWPPAYYGRGLGLITIYKADSNYVVITGYAPYTNPASGYWRLVKIAGKWSPVEYSDPPMELGVEYRTTERYLGKPVYAQLFQCTPLPNNTEQSYKFGITGISRIVDWSATFSGGDPIPTYNTTNQTEIKVNLLSKSGGGSIRFQTNYDATGSTAYVLLKYTK